MSLLSRIGARPLDALAVTVAACVIAGCTLGPNYARPPVDTPQSYRFAGVASSQATAEPTLEALPAWWRRFDDAQLDALVDEGLSANRDLRIATARVQEFAAIVTATHAQALPQIGYGASASRQRVSPRAVPLPPNANPISDTYVAGLSASWEIDLWGRIRRQDEAARANLLATEQARLGVALTLVSNIVSSYITLLDLDRRLEIAKSTLESRKKTVDLFRTRMEGGALSEFEMMQVTAEYETAEAAIPDLQQAIAQQEDALCVLIGRNPGPIARGGTLKQLVAPPIPPGLPSELIARRPDILQAENQLIAANALIGAARALYFPTLSLTGTGGSASKDLDNLFGGQSHTWSFAGQALGPIFAGGAIKAANQQAEARRDQALEAYQQTIQSAFRDVDDALVAIQSKRTLVASLERQVAALDRAVELTHDRYENGYTDYLEVLDTERSQFSSELALTAARGDSYRALVGLYRAMGGDWIPQVAPLSATSTGGIAQNPGADAMHEGNTGTH